MFEHGMVHGATAALLHTLNSMIAFNMVTMEIVADAPILDDKAFLPLISAICEYACGSGASTTWKLRVFKVLSDSAYPDDILLKLFNIHIEAFLNAVAFKDEQHFDKSFKLSFFKERAHCYVQTHRDQELVDQANKYVCWLVHKDRAVPQGEGIAIIGSVPQSQPVQPSEHPYIALCKKYHRLKTETPTAFPGGNAVNDMMRLACVSDDADGAPHLKTLLKKYYYELFPVASVSDGRP